MLLNVLQLLLNFNEVYTDLSICDIQKTVNDVFKNDPNTPSKDLTLLKESIANPLIGFFANKSGLNNNIRFFSPYIQPAYKNSQRNYLDDKSSDPMTSLFIKLYPSPAGQLTTSKASILDPLSLFNINKKEYVEFFANLFIAIANDNNIVNFECTKGKENNIKFKARKRFFDEVKALFFTKATNSIFNDKAMKLIFIHSYIINILDPQVSDVEVDYFKLYLKEIAKSHEISENCKFLNIKVCNEILQKSVDYYNTMNSFPYSSLNRPEASKSIPSYDKQTEAFNENVRFLDSAEISLLHLCNCLFFYKGKYSTDHLPNLTYNLYSFYMKHSKPFTLTTEIRNDWSKVVQDLNENVEDNLIYPAENISYSLFNKNQVKGGIINMMNVLIKITGVKAENIFDGIDKNNLEERLEKLIHLISVKESVGGRNVVRVATVKVDMGSLNEVETFINDKRDFCGSFSIVFEYLNKTGGIINVSHANDLSHTEVLFEPLKNSKLDMSNNDKILEKLASPSFQNLLFKSILFPEEKGLKTNFDIYLKKLYLNDIIENNSSSLIVLEKLYKFIKELERPENIEKTEILSKIMHHILDKVNLNNLREKMMFKKFLCFNMPVFKEKVIDFALSSYYKSLIARSTFFVKKWEEYFSNELPNVENLDLTDLGDYLTKNNFIGKKMKDHLIENFRIFVNIKELNLSKVGLNEEELLRIIRNLRNPEKIESLDLSFNPNLGIPKEIENLTGLKSINLSYCGTKIISSNILSLKSLEDLNMAGNYFRNDFSISFSNFTNLKKLNISTTGFSNDFLNCLLNCKKLQQLDISHNPISLLPEEMAKLKNLAVLNIKATQISSIPQNIQELRFLTILCSKNSRLTDQTKFDFRNQIRELW